MTPILETPATDYLLRCGGDGAPADRRRRKKRRQTISDESEAEAPQPAANPKSDGSPD
jgi:hypothetical protein